MKTVISPKWQPTASGRQYALERGMSQDRVGEEVEHFKEHGIKHGTKYENHDMAWQGWVRKAIEFRGRDTLPDSGAPLFEQKGPALSDKHYKARVHKVAKDPFWDAYAEAGKPRGFRCVNGRYEWPGKEMAK